jgi:hypothetical protein
MLPLPFEPTNSVKHYLDPVANRVKYRVLSPTGATIAEAIDVESLARQIACIDEVTDAFEYLMDHINNDFGYWRHYLNWSMTTIAEIAEDIDGAYSKEYPDMPKRAEILMELNDLKAYVMQPFR